MADAGTNVGWLVADAVLASAKQGDALQGNGRQRRLLGGVQVVNPTPDVRSSGGLAHAPAFVQAAKPP